MIAALYVENGGVYCGLPSVDPWHERSCASLSFGTRKPRSRGAPERGRSAPPPPIASSSGARPWLSSQQPQRLSEAQAFAISI